MSSKFMRGSPLLTSGNTVPGLVLTAKEKEVFLEVLAACTKYGLDYFPTIIQKVTHDEMSEIAAYGGFPRRFPHWKWGMEYEEMQRGYMHGMHKIFELVINSSPCVMYLHNANTLLDNATVVAHATGHNDFFKNNLYFQPTDRNMVNKMGSHARRVQKYMDRWGIEKVTEFLDHIMRIETMIDPAKAWTQREIKDSVIVDARTYEMPRRFVVDSNNLHMDPWINTKEWKESEARRVAKVEAAKELELFTRPEKDVFGYIKDHAPLKPWQADIASMLYEESMYFAPQRVTKIANEGFACVRYNSLLPTNKGFLKIGEIVDKKMKVSVYDGQIKRKVTNWFKFEDREIYKITTAMGYEVEGSENHRVQDSFGNWVRLDAVVNGLEVKLGKSSIWPDKQVKINWESLRLTKTITEITQDLGVGWNELQKSDSQLLKDYHLERQKCSAMQNRRKSIKVPKEVDEKLAYWLGLMIGDGHISPRCREIGLTTGDDSQADLYVEFTKELFGLETSRRWDDSSLNGRWRLAVYSRNLQDFCEHLGMKTGSCARQKAIPDCVLRSPKNVVAAFLRGLFDCDGYAGPQGVILSTSSIEMSKQVQMVLLNFGIVSKRTLCAKDIWQVSIRGQAAVTYFEHIGFALERKNERLAAYFHPSWPREMPIKDKIVSVEKIGRDDVYDITVEETHQYCAQGFVNHNSFIDYEIMTRQGFVGVGQKTHDDGIIEYAKHKAGVLGGKMSMNPYKIGFYLLLDIEERWNKGQFGQEWEDCKDMHAKRNWDKNLGLGKQKLFEVRKYYDDITLIQEFFTQEFCDKFEFYLWKRFPNGEYRIESRDAKVIKKRLLMKHSNGGLPDVRLVDPNYKNQGMMLLEHQWDGRPLHESYVRDVMTSINYFWNRQVILSTKNTSGKEYVFVCDGRHAEKDVALVTRDDYERKW